MNVCVGGGYLYGDMMIKQHCPSGAPIFPQTFAPPKSKLSLFREKDWTYGSVQYVLKPIIPISLSLSPYLYPKSLLLPKPKLSLFRVALDI